MPVQRVCRPNSAFRGFQGTIAAGNIHVGDEIRVMPSGEKAHVTEILCGNNQVQMAEKGYAVTICIDG